MIQQRTPRTARRSPPKEEMTHEEFLKWADGRHMEWVNEKVVFMRPVSRKHQNIAGFLTTLLSIYAEVHDLAEVLSAPFQMKMENGREPDVTFVAREHESRFKESYLDGIYHAEAVPGFWVRASWLWLEPLPKTMDVLGQLEVV